MRGSRSSSEHALRCICRMRGDETRNYRKVTGKDFYDAVVSISKINAVIYKAR